MLFCVQDVSHLRFGITFRRCSRGKSRLMRNFGIMSKHSTTYQRSSSMLLHFSRPFSSLGGHILTKSGSTGLVLDTKVKFSLWWPGKSAPLSITIPQCTALDQFIYYVKEYSCRVRNNTIKSKSKRYNEQFSFI